MKNLYLLLLIPFFGVGQTQIGQDIIGTGHNGDYYLGQCTSLSADGNVLAVGTYVDSGIFSGVLSVNVYRNVNSVWTLVGGNISPMGGVGEGFKISISSDGSTLAISGYLGEARIYKNISDTWVQIGNGINDGRSNVSLSSDGSIVASSDFFTDGTWNGVVRIHKNINGVWTQIGNSINAPNTEDYFGSSISISADGNILAVGASRSDFNGTDSGAVLVYKNTANVWTQIGSTIQGEAAGDFFGENLSLSSDGNTLAVGASNNDSTGSNSGHVRIYENIADVWTQIGTDIDGEFSNEHFGSSVSLSFDGETLAVSASEITGVGRRYVRIYKNIANQWVQTGADISSDSYEADSYRCVSLSSDGTTVAIGDPDYNGVDGRVQVYNLSPLLNSDAFVASNFTIHPNPASDIVNINLNDNLALQKVNIYSTSGQLLKSENSKSFTINEFSTGTYFVEVLTNKGKATKTIVVK